MKSYALGRVDGDEQLSRPAREFISNPAHTILVSAASAWEIATKVRIGKLPGAVEIASCLPECLAEQGFVSLPISLGHALLAGNLLGIHRDPFDRMLIAQAQIENLYLISNEALFDQYGVLRLW